METQKTEDRPTVNLPSFCDKHLSALVHGSGYGPHDAWQALAVVSQIALFQIATSLPSIQRRLDGKIERIEEIGCFACRLPSAFKSIVRLGKDGKGSAEPFSRIKAFGESRIGINEAE